MTTTSPPNQPGSGGTTRVVLLIDADNVSPDFSRQVLELARKHGEIVRCFAFGRRRHKAWSEDGTMPALEWGEGSSETSGRNSADIDLTATAVDLLYTDDIDTFCIASGDKDFTGLVKLLQRRGKKVVGIAIGIQASGDFIRTCDEVELLDTRPRQAVPHKMHPRTAMAALVTERKANAREHFLELVKYVIAVHGPGWWPVTWLADQLSKVGRIRYKDHGKATLTEVLESYPKEIETMETPAGVKMRLRTQLSVRQIRTIRSRPPVRRRDQKATDVPC